jgi:hypothetical protein
MKDSYLKHNVNYCLLNEYQIEDIVLIRSSVRIIHKHIVLP